MAIDELVLSRKLRLLAALQERKDAYQDSLNADMIDALTELEREGLIQTMDSGIIRILPRGQEAYQAALDAFKKYLED